MKRIWHNFPHLNARGKQLACTQDILPGWTNKFYFCLLFSSRFFSVPSSFISRWWFWARRMHTAIMSAAAAADQKLMAESHWQDAWIIMFRKWKHKSFRVDNFPAVTIWVVCGGWMDATAASVAIATAAAIATVIKCEHFVSYPFRGWYIFYDDIHVVFGFRWFCLSNSCIHTIHTHIHVFAFRFVCSREIVFCILFNFDLMFLVLSSMSS